MNVCDPVDRGGAERGSRHRSGSNQPPTVLNVKTARSWRGIVFFYAPRAGGAYDSHHRTTGIASCTRRRGGCVAARGARPLVVRWVGALGCPSSSRRRNIKQSPQYGPHLLTVRKHGAAIMRASDDAATRNARRGWRNRVPAETGFASADAMQRYRCVPDPTWPQLSRLS